MGISFWVYSENSNARGTQVEGSGKTDEIKPERRW